MKLHDNFFERIKSWVKQNNTTIEFLMKAASNGEWNQATYYGWRKLDVLPKGENIFALAQYMGVSCDWLISGKDNLADSADARLQLLARYGDFLRDFETLDESGRFAVTQLAHTLAASKPPKASITQNRAV